jgi:glycosyltransferase involved in cell wall biosynthesis
VAVYVVTYRRTHLLRRALKSLIAQSHDDFVATVLNDDPSDNSVADLIAELGDKRITLSLPLIKRGGPGNFNLAFEESGCQYASILEDDNWWEPEFLAHMLAALVKHPAIDIASGNQRLWREQADGTWTDRGKCIWTDQSDRVYQTTFEAACGSQTISNSALLFKTRLASTWLTPDDIPIDVTEHFRERVIAQPVLLVGRPLVNFAETLVSNRDSSGMVWGAYQVLLVGSMFCATRPSDRRVRAQELWKSVNDKLSPRAISLLMAAVVILEARELWKQAPLRSKLRFLVTALRHPLGLLESINVREKHREHWDFLVNSPLARRFSSLREQE